MGKLESFQPSAKTNTFIVQVLYRQNGTWQGVIKWTNGKKEQYFRSALEMIKLMDEAMESDSAAAELSPQGQAFS